MDLSTMLRIICEVLGCKSEDIKDIAVLHGGFTNNSYIFSVNSEKFVFRAPGKKTEEIINREHEYKSLKLVKELGIDTSCIAMNPHHGGKISKFLDNCYIPDYQNFNDSRLVIKKLKELHNKMAHVDGSFDPLADVVFMEKQVVGKYNVDQKLKNDVQTIYRSIKNDNVIEKIFCHCDIYNANFLINKETKEVHLLDGEYAGESDPAIDVAYYIVDAMYEFKDAIRFIKEYTQNDDDTILRHYLAYIPIIAYYWYIGGMYRESCGSVIGEVIDNWKYMADKYSCYYLEQGYAK